jgi:cell wall-associated NlpC family hydrolase
MMNALKTAAFTAMAALVVTAGNAGAGCLITPCRYTQVALSSPTRTEVRDSANNWLATYTNNSYTVKVKGPSRTFSEPVFTETNTTQYSVTTNVWQRVLKSKFTGTVDEAQLENWLADSSPDTLALAMQYVYGASTVNVGNIRMSDNAEYGAGAGADFNDYLGISWNYGTYGGTDSPETGEFGEMDCSGYVRMIFGYRQGMTLTLNTRPGVAIPRTSAEQCNTADSLGVTLVPNTGVKPSSSNYSKLTAGDLVCFDATPDGTIDHIGMYLGQDSGGHYRFLSSRNSLLGPTMNDSGVSSPPCYSPSTLDGCGWAPDGWRSAVRF